MAKDNRAVVAQVVIEYDAEGRDFLFVDRDLSDILRKVNAIFSGEFRFKGAYKDIRMQPYCTNCNRPRQEDDDGPMCCNKAMDEHAGEV